MLEKLRNFIAGVNSAEPPRHHFDADDRRLAEAALMFHVIAADGVVEDVESERLRAVLASRYDLDEQETAQLIDEARDADAEAIDLYRFTSVLKRQLDDDERASLVEGLWEMVYADGVVHELEDNVVWRVAELLSVSGRLRMEMKQRVRQRLQDDGETQTGAEDG